ncbi:MAG: hypothetical protein IJ333_06080 [Clostridia bacterium]|nr:hypothetical protein [Clostridia bacterium]
MSLHRQRILESRGTLYAVMILLASLVVLVLALGGAFLFHLNKDFYSALQGELNRGFYLSAALILIFSSVVYTPFSYGISHYFIRSAQGEVRFSALFFLFRHPLLLTKATAVSMIKKLLVYLERLAVLLTAAVLEVGLFLSFLVVTGEDIFAVEGNPFLLAAEFMLRSPWLVGLSIALWSLVLFSIFIIYLRYILCKYVLLEYPDASVWQAVRIGKSAIRGHFFQTLLFYLRYGAFCVLNVLSFGFYARLTRQKHCSFSVYACQLVHRGWQDYCRKRSLRNE